MNTHMRKASAALWAITLLGSLTAALPAATRADDAKDKPVAKGKEKKPEIPIKIVDPIIVPDKGKGKSR